MYREALSARLDGEEVAGEWRPSHAGDGRHVDAAAVDAHLDSCDPCRSWYADAATITRRARLGSVEVGSVENGGGENGGGGIRDAVLDATPRPTRARIARGLRLVLGG